MIYKIRYDGDVEEVIRALENCEKTTVNVANAFLAKLATEEMAIEDTKEHVTHLIKLAKNLGALEVYKGIVDGTFEEDDANE